MYSIFDSLTKAQIIKSDTTFINLYNLNPDKINVTFPEDSNSGNMNMSTVTNPPMICQKRNSTDQFYNLIKVVISVPLVQGISFYIGPSILSCI